MLHPGHLNIIEHARRYAGKNGEVIVGLFTDKAISTGEYMEIKIRHIEKKRNLPEKKITVFRIWTKNTEKFLRKNQIIKIVKRQYLLHRLAKIKVCWLIKH